MGYAPQGMPGQPGQQQAQQQPLPEESEEDGPRAVKRPRLVWTEALHRKFIEVVQQLGVDKAQPKTVMQVRGAGAAAAPAAAAVQRCWMLGCLRAGCCFTSAHALLGSCDLGAGPHRAAPWHPLRR
jgi:SHAQKYF class myb-like DNA-binding protein